MPESNAQSSSRDTNLLPFLACSIFLFALLGALFLIPEKALPRTPNSDYLRALADASQPAAAMVSHSLVPINFGQPLTVVTWTQKSRIPDYQGKATPAYKD